jgi:putative ABC transport system ATP-binding protein
VLVKTLKNKQPIMIALKNIFKYYDNKFQRTFVLKDVNLTIAEGEFVAIMGPSGCGKSTRLNILGLLDYPTTGDYFFDGQVLTEVSNKL